MKNQLRQNFDSFGVMVDCSRNSVMTVETVKKLVDVLSDMGYNSLQLYTEDTFEVEGEPYFGYMRGRYTTAEMRAMDEYARTKGVELIPCVQTLAHLQKLFRWKPYWGINDINDILLVEEPRTEQLIENIFKTIANCFTSRTVNIGMDEAHLLGLGSYLHKHGYCNRGEIMQRHLKKVAEIAEKYGFTCMMWSDMFFRLAFKGEYYADEEKTLSEDVSALIPHNVDLVYWDYYSTEEKHFEAMIKSHKRIKEKVIFAGGGWTWNGLTPHNQYAIQSTKAALGACLRNGVRSAFITLWGDDGDGCSPFTVLPTLFLAAKYAGGETDDEAIKAEFEKRYGIPFDTFMRVDLPNIVVENQPVGCTNASKYLLYNDTLMGIFDSTVREGVGVRYTEYARLLSEAEKHPEWGFIFRPLIALCEALSVKAELGVKTRKAYEAGDRVALKKLAQEDYALAYEKVSALYESWKEYWHALYKPHGFDVIDLRLGGVLHRMKHVAEKLTAYAEGKTDRIAELDEKALDYLGGEEVMAGQPIGYNGFNTNVTVNSL